MSCGETGNDAAALHTGLDAYYYDLDALSKGGLVYRYDAVGTDTVPSEFWHLTSVESEGNRFMISSGYDQFFRPSFLIYERLVPGGTVIHDYQMNMYDTANVLQPIKPVIDGFAAYPFEIESDETVFVFEMSWALPSDPNQTYTFIRNRRFVGIQDCMVQGKESSCAEFEIREKTILDDKKEGGMELESINTERYAKDIGLVYFDKRSNGVTLRAFQLGAVMTTADFEAIAQKQGVEKLLITEIQNAPK